MNTLNAPKMAVLALLMIPVVGGIFYLDSKKVSRDAVGGKVDVKTTANTQEKTNMYTAAKEITTPDGFINTGGMPVTIGEFVGKKVVLLDIWTYSCINCQRTTPYLNTWYEKYKDDGLVIIGLHTPEFEFEKVYENVLAATQRLQIKYPVVLDNDYSTWNAYQNRFWPRKYLIDIDGFVVYDHIGEGGYEETEAKIVELLNERSARLGMDAVAKEDGVVSGVDATDFSKIKTPEAYFGSARVQYLANLPTSGCKDGVCNFTSSGNPALNTFELSGAWKINDEDAVLQRGNGSVFLRFSANKANLVAGATGNPVRAEIYLDGKKVTDETAGDAVQKGIVTFEAHDLYNLIDLKGNYGEHVVEIRFLDSGVSAFAFTFG